MLDSSWLWVLFTLIAAAAQTVRNATQRELTTSLGTAGATHVRFLFGLPFALVFLAVVLLASGATLPSPRAIGRGSCRDRSRRLPPPRSCSPP
jgi:di/tricarboxylate transporter